MGSEYILDCAGAEAKEREEEELVVWVLDVCNSFGKEEEERLI